MSKHFMILLNTLKLSLERVSNNKKAAHWAYANLDTIMESIQPALSEQSWMIQEAIKGSSVVTELIYIGDALPDERELPCIESVFNFPSDLDPMDAGKAITYGRRYNIKTLLNIRTGDEDTDGQSIRRNGRSSRRSRRSNDSPEETEIY
jgi:hypothetical protein